MGLVFTGNPPILQNIITEIPTANYSGISSDDANTSVNPYTGQGPGAGGAGQTASEVATSRGAGGPNLGDVVALEGKEGDLLFAIGFNDATTTPTTNSIGAVVDALTVNNSGGPDLLSSGFQGYASGWIRAAVRISYTTSTAPSDKTYVAWYKGNQPGITSATPHQAGVNIFGEEAGTAGIGFGVDDGKCAIAQTVVTRGTTDVTDDNWHFLTWVHRGATEDLYVNGVKEGTATDTTSDFHLRPISEIGSGFAYTNVVAPTNLDGIQIYNVAFTDQEVLDLYTQQLA